MNMKTWTNPTVEELEVEQTASGYFDWYWESFIIPGLAGGTPNPDNGTGDDNGTGTDNEIGTQMPGTDEPGKEDAPSGRS